MPVPEASRTIFESAYRRLRQNLAAKDVSTGALRQAVLDALDAVRLQIEHDDSIAAEELARLQNEPHPQILRVPLPPLER